MNHTLFRTARAATIRIVIAATLVALGWAVGTAQMTIHTFS